MSQNAAAKVLSVGRTSVQAARVVLDYGVPEVVVLDEKRYSTGRTSRQAGPP